MLLLFPFFLGCVGLFFGSFFLVVAQRLATNTSFIRGRSQCDYCHHVLSWIELIPVVSFLFQGGKCKHCRKKLSWWYPLSELMTGMTFLIVGLYATTAFSLIGLLVITSCLLIIFFSDREYEIIPLQPVIIACVAEVVMLAFAPSIFLNHLLSALGASLFFYIIYIATRRKGMGFGDVIFAFLMGFVLGFPYIIFGLYFSFLSGAIISLILVALKKKKLHGGTVPFGPFLVLGTFTMMVWGKDLAYLISRYVSF